VDELNRHIGLLIAQAALPDTIRAILIDVQHELFDLGGELCIPGHAAIKDSHVERLEQALDALNADLPPLKEFILPGGNVAAATAHVARAVCRRAERRVVSLAHAESVNAPVLGYLNRLSDLLFVIARVLARADGGEVLWRHER
jgi:cob(I)alamin adenosyltransferase